jgi:hypothetical protein
MKEEFMPESLRKHFVIISCVFLLALIAGSAFGQEYRGRIQGNVTDSSKGAIPGAMVNLLNVKTNIGATRVTNEVGHYLFDLVDPGTYRLTVEMKGFNKTEEDNISVPSRADLTINAELKLGDITETVTVNAAAATLQFTSSKLDMNVNQKLVANLPLMYRNVFLMAQLDPSVQSTSYGEDNPYDAWASNNMRIGGSGSFTNDLQVDGSPSGITVKTGYVPAPEMVAEVNVLQNASDAEYGHSSGSAISIVLKSGNNEFHGSGFGYFQRPDWNAIDDRVYRVHNGISKSMYGGTFSHPIIKNKLFNFVSYEGWDKLEPASLFNSLPTERERTGDFSKTLTENGDLRLIYDPWSTKTAADGTVTRTPFPNNIIPSSRISPVAAKFAAALWKPNRTAVDNYNLNNYGASTPITYPYKNFSDRVDYQVTEKLRVNGRFSIIMTPVAVTGNPTGSPMFMSDRGANYNNISYSGDATYTLNPKTVLNFHGGYHAITDQSHFATDFAPEWGWKGVFPNSDFYKAVFADPTIPNLIPRMSIYDSPNGNSMVQMGPGGGYWHETPHAFEFSAKIAQQHGSHYLKAGVDVRRNHTNSLLLNSNAGFGFDAEPTASTYVNPDLLLSGDPFATFLLGAVTPLQQFQGSGAADLPGYWDSNATGMPINISPDTRTWFYGVYINDDWKIGRNLTLNLGLRYEYESPFIDGQNRLTRALDLSAPIPELQGITMPDDVKQFYKGTWAMNGAFQFASGDHPGAWDGGWGTLSPRIGAAYKLNDKTVIRGSGGRYVTPWTTNSGHDQLSGYPLFGYSNFTGAPESIQGVPQMSLDNPFPASHPVAPSYEKSLGIYTMLGDSLYYFSPDRKRSISDRVNVAVQRQLPWSMVLDVTYYLNHTSQVFQTDYDINQVDPNIGYTYKEQTNAVIDNPFYNILTVEKFPGQLRYQPQVGVTQLARPYPQYGSINVVDGADGGSMKYQALQLKLTKAYSQGLSLLAGYSYHLEKDQRFYNDIANYKREFSWFDANGRNSFRHRLTVSASWDLPIGKGQRLMSGASRLVDSIVGGWKFSPTMSWNSGILLPFGGMLYDGTDPKVSNPTIDHWFNTDAFTRLPDYTPRTNPTSFAGLRGPQFINWDAQVSKKVNITERVAGKFEVAAFNMFNNLRWDPPNMNVSSSNFGAITNQAYLSYGRRLQLGVRVEF